jgi:apolipoprotein N-acyltransferase
LSWIPLLDQIPKDALAAPRGKLFSVAGEKVAPVLSFEGDFGSLVRQRIAAGGRLLVVATNTSTWRTTPASAQHLALSQVRAAENGIWVVHAALSGISAFVAPDGSVASSTPLWKATSIVHRVRFASTTTLYTRLGDWLPFLCLVVSLFLVAIPLIRRALTPPL